MIKHINPLAVTAGLFLILCIVFLSVGSKRSSIEENALELSKFEAKAKNLKSLKQTWSQKNVHSKLNSILSSPKLKEIAKITSKKSKITLELKSIDKNQLDMIVKNLLNESFEIKNIKIKRLDEITLDLKVEVAK